MWDRCWGPSLHLTPPSCLRQGPIWETGTPELSAGNLFLCSTLMSEAFAHGTSQQAGPGPAADGCRAIDLVALWSPQLAHPLIHPPSHRVPCREKGKLPAAFIHLEASSGFHTATSRNTFDHLNPGCVNSPDPLNSKGCSLISNGSSVSSVLVHLGATWGTGGG